MAQLRQDYPEFRKRNTEILTIGPDGPKAFRIFWENQQMPFVGLSDVGNQVADLYSQEVNLLKFGRMPAVFIIDLAGRIRFAHYGKSMSDIPENKDILRILDNLEKESQKTD